MPYVKECNTKNEYSNVIIFEFSYSRCIRDDQDVLEMLVDRSRFNINLLKCRTSDVPLVFHGWVSGCILDVLKM